MKIHKHAIVSFAAGALILVVFRNLRMSIACFLTGVLIDLDHILDYYINHELKEKLRYLLHPREFLSFLSNEDNKANPLRKVYKVLHSLELLLPLFLLYVFGIWSDIATGILIGFSIHIIMDITSLGHIGAGSVLYRMSKGFPCGSDIYKQRLSRIGKDVNKCELCGTLGETLIHRRRYWYGGFTRRSISKTMLLCSKCHEKLNNR